MSNYEVPVIISERIFSVQPGFFSGKIPHGQELELLNVGSI